MEGEEEREGWEGERNPLKTEFVRAPFDSTMGSPAAEQCE